MPPLPGRRVVLAEDDDALREILRRALEAGGFVVEDVARGDEALERCRAAPPDLIVTDILMPGLPGPVLLERLRQEKIEAPALIISTEIDEAARKLAGGDPRIAALRKPFSLGEFQGAIRGLLGEAQEG